MNIIKKTIAGHSEESTFLQFNYNGEDVEHVFSGSSSDEINRLVGSNKNLQNAIDAGKPAKRRQPSINYNSYVINLLKS